MKQRFAERIGWWLALGGAVALAAGPAAAQSRSRTPGQFPAGGMAFGPLPSASGAPARNIGPIGNCPPNGPCVPNAWGGWTCPPGNNWFPNNCYPYYGYPAYTAFPVYSTFGFGYPYGGYGGYGYGGYAAPGNTTVVIDRRVYVGQPPDGSGAQNPAPARNNGGSTASPPASPTPPPASAPQSAPEPGTGKSRRDDFYLTRPVAAEELTAALKDIRQAWLNGDFSRLKDRIAGAAGIRIFPQGKYAYTMSADEFTRITRDAMKMIETTAFDLDPPATSGSDRAFVTGRHTYRASPPDRSEPRAATVFVSYTLQLKDGMWRIVEAGSSTDAYRGHEE